MNKIEELINELCPEGVEHIELGRMVKLNSYKQLGASELESLKAENGDIKLLPSSNNDNWFTNKELAKDYICSGEVFTMGRARNANIKYVNGQFISSNNIIIESSDKSKLLTRFLYHFVINYQRDIYTETSTYPKFDSNIFKKLKIPVPPIEIQREIVKILDNFTQITAELTAELTARKQQYEFYRDKLLNFNTSNEGQGIEFKAIKDLLNELVFIVSPPNKLKKNKYKNQGLFPIIDQGQKDICGYTDDNENLVPKNSYVLFGDHTEIFKYFEGRFAQGADGLKIMRTDENFLITKFYYYLLNCYYKTKGGYDRHWKFLSEISIPIPPIEKQKEIVEKLDKFSKLVEDVSEGLPAEIEARKKQYEYYRDKLLTFKEKAN